MTAWRCGKGGPHSCTCRGSACRTRDRLVLHYKNDSLEASWPHKAVHVEEGSTYWAHARLALHYEDGRWPGGVARGAHIDVHVEGGSTRGTCDRVTLHYRDGRHVIWGQGSSHNCTC